MSQRNLPWKPAHPLIGRLIAERFLITSFICEGRITQIFCGKEDDPARHVSLKIVHPEIADDADVVGRFLVAADRASRLDHPNALQVFASGEERGVLYLASELVFGENLRTAVETRGPMSPPAAVRIAADICAVLEHAHERGVLHHALRPENVLLCRQPDAPEQEIVKVSDFGMANVVETVEPPLEYMAPEGLRREVLDVRADVYGVGQLLYEMLTGTKPFVGLSQQETKQRLLHERLLRVPTHEPLHARLEALILRTLEKDAEARPQTARELGSALEAIMPELSSLSDERWRNRDDATTTKDAARAGLETSPRLRPDPTARRGDRHPLIGEVLSGRFRVASFMREGGMGQLFCAIQSEEPTHVAIKIMHPEIADEADVVKRFIREARIVAQLDHPNIVRIVHVGEEQPLLYIAMELLFGEELSSRLKQRGAFAEAHAAEIVIELCSALEYAHARGVVHRDIKPENIMICRDPRAPDAEVVKVLDFGIAKVLDAKPSLIARHDQASIVRSGCRSALTAVGELVGTPRYMSPEQGAALPLNHRTDLYAVGVVLYELTCGKPPFDGETPLQIVSRHVQEAPTAPTEIVPTLHPQLERIILSLLAKDPALRPQSATVVREALVKLLPELSPIQGAAPLRHQWVNRTMQMPAVGAAETQAPKPPEPPNVEIDDEETHDADTALAALGPRLPPSEVAPTTAPMTVPTIPIAASVQNVLRQHIPPSPPVPTAPLRTHADDLARQHEARLVRILGALVALLCVVALALVAIILFR